MGADIYLNSIYKPNYKKYEAAFSLWVHKRNHFVSYLPTELQQGGYEKKGIKLNSVQKMIITKIKHAQEKVTYNYDRMYSKGYFRDSYNGTGVLQRMGLSWWQDVSKLYNKNGNLGVRGCKSFLKMLKAAELKLPTEKELKEQHCTVDKDNTVEDWHKLFIGKRTRLIRLVEKAIELKEPLYCSC